ncbi:MAG TPA: hypothetical protein VJI96_03625 [Candidatus Andersenbacteria bacterium]|nr:hypothetical protein [Candidatus Andersenbacteria bacterium]
MEEKLNQEEIQPQPPSPSPKTWLVATLIAVVTVLVIGISVFAWQSMTNQEQITELQDIDYATNISSESPIIKEGTVPSPIGNPESLGDFRAVMSTSDEKENTTIYTFNGTNFAPSFHILGRDIYLLNDKPYIYAPQENAQGFVVKDLTGQDLSMEYPFLEDSKKKFSILNAIQVPGEKLLVVTRSDGEEGADIKIQDYEGKIVDTITSTILPKGIITTRPVGWSADKNYLYLTKIGWEGYDYANLWKMNWKTKDITEVKGVLKVTLGRLSMVPEKDIAVGAVSKETSCTDCFSGVRAGVPSELRLFSLSKNTSTIPYKSTEHVLTSPILSPNGKRIFYEEVVNDNENEYVTHLYSIDADGRNRQKIAEQSTVLGVSYDGERVLTVTYAAFNGNLSPGTMHDLKNGSSTSVSIPTYTKRFSNGTSKEEMANGSSCGYPLGYSCLYSEKQ